MLAAQATAFSRALLHHLNVLCSSYLIVAVYAVRPDVYVCVRIAVFIVRVAMPDTRVQARSAFKASCRHLPLATCTRVLASEKGPICDSQLPNSSIHPRTLHSDPQVVTV